MWCVDEDEEDNDERREGRRQPDARKALRTPSIVVLACISNISPLPLPHAHQRQRPLLTSRVSCPCISRLPTRQACRLRPLRPRHPGSGVSRPKRGGDVSRTLQHCAPPPRAPFLPLHTTAAAPPAPTGACVVCTGGDPLLGLGDRVLGLGMTRRAFRAMWRGAVWVECTGDPCGVAGGVPCCFGPMLFVVLIGAQRSSPLKRGRACLCATKLVQNKCETEITVLSTRAMGCVRMSGGQQGHRQGMRGRGAALSGLSVLSARSAQPQADEAIHTAGAEGDREQRAIVSPIHTSTHTIANRRVHGTMNNAEWHLVDLADPCACPTQGSIPPLAQAPA